VIKLGLAGAFAGAVFGLTALPVQAAVDNDLPVRWNTGGAVWSTNQAAIDTFLESGEVTDRGLRDGLNQSGWTDEEVREGMNKTYDVDFLGVYRFLYSAEGEEFLDGQTASYFPYWSMKKYSVQALRSAILSDAYDGEISSAGIMKALPVDMRLADTCGTYTGAQNVCAPDSCEGDAQCTSLFSWYVFLPACIQANQILPATGGTRSAAPAPSAVRGLW
jgi:hypothetical protein